MINFKRPQQMMSDPNALQPQLAGAAPPMPMQQQLPPQGQVPGQLQPGGSPMQNFFGRPMMNSAQADPENRRKMFFNRG